ncbi:MAG: T9SS type A sorting domain-containing protein [Chitinophagaceae bacterium]
MKKILFSIVFVALLGAFKQASAQCNGSSVQVTNVVVTNSGLTYNYSYDWRYVNGNASILVVLLCNGVVVAQGPCLDDLKSRSGSNPNLVFHEANSVTYPSACAGLKEIEFRIHASQNCNGNFCPLPSLSPLPVNFAAFTATRNKANVSISWSTASEQNNSGFAVERNVNGTWEQIAFVASQSFNGNSSSLLSYSYTDFNNVKGVSQYRIKQIDINATAKYSDIKAVVGESQGGRTVVYPNPSDNGKINVVFDNASATSRDVTVTDMSGRIVKQLRGVTNNNVTIENLNPGIYSLRVVVPATGDQSVEKIVVNKR